ncbi:sensor histidine kinase [Natrarchaeobius chitinivorans]|uniref:sensor histidine kinase n=1 Tax=Natrarchaeobius chitinivorans TaxID=1679083 RepID=UPI0014042871|nr:hybrid sensor histidine kinase/response regulator [Natrarchaeobius chitinivorans]
MQSPSIRLLVDDDANRNALAELLEQRYDVLTDGPDLDGDLYLVDDFSFPTYRDRLESIKAETEPSFVPVVLVRREETHVDLDLTQGSEDGDRPLIDEVISAPVRKAVLYRRLSNLLVRRRQFNRLEEQNERLDRFASVVSHDLRNPIQVAQGRLDLVEPEISPPEREHVEVARESLDRMNSLIDDVLALAREGETVDDPVCVSLETTAMNAWTVVETPDAKLSVSAGTGAIVADPDRLATVFENLFRNAIEHGGADVTVDVGTTETGFYVADDGSGIPSDERDDVKERGYSRNGGGTGLGLDIVNTIVDAHGWSLAIGESESGGARFDVSGVEWCR